MRAGMVLDELFLLLQNGLDRLVRRLRLGTKPAETRRRFLVVQIDGLARSVLKQGLADGLMPFVNQLLARRGYRLQPMSVGIPTSTPAFQMAAMYGVPPNIPGFHYHDKRRRTDIHFPLVGHAALVEAEHAQGRLGILRGGSVYGCVFTGGAENSLFSFAELKRPSGPGILRVLSASVVLLWVVVKGTVRTVIELARALARFTVHPGTARKDWEWLKIKVGISVWIRELFTLAVSRDMYAGVPAVFVNYLDYDVAAHAFGPRDRRAFEALGHVDRSIHQLSRILRRVPEYRYDLYILADHGQAASTHYDTLTRGKPIQHLLFDEFLDPAHASQPATSAAGQPRYAHGFQAYRIGEKGLSQRLVHYLDPSFARDVDQREAHERGGVRVIAAGPNAFLYVVDTVEPLTIEMLEKRFPNLAENISRSRGVGLVLARSANGPVCFWRGERYRLGTSDPAPLATREDRDVVLRGLADLMAMPSAGDLVIYGTDTPEGHVSYIAECGAHAGPSPEELHTFIVYPRHVTLPEPITHPLQLYDHFISYQAPGSA
jgi:hypothetical protein